MHGKRETSTIRARGLLLSWVVSRIAGCAVVTAVLLSACDSSVPPLATAQPGVMFTFPGDGQRDVPLGSRIVVTFTDNVATSALGPCSGSGASVTGAFCLVGPDGPVNATAEVVGDGRSVQFAAAALAEATTYQLYVRQALAPDARNLPATGPLVTFTKNVSSGSARVSPLTRTSNV